MIRLVPMLVVAGCATDLGEDPLVQDVLVTDVAEGLHAAQPEPLVDLFDEVALLVAEDPACPLREILTTESGVLHERLHGGCSTGDGLTIRGSLERYADATSEWLATEDFSVYQGGALRLAVSGSVEAREQGELMLLDGALSWCGAGDVVCDDGPVWMDLAYSIFPASGYPEQYDGTVTGAVGASEGILTVEGVWSTDLAVCRAEAASGTFSVRGGQRHVVSMDGASVCDGCASWTVGGRAGPAWCGPDPVEYR